MNCLMYFLNNKEVNYEFIFNSTLKKIYIKKNIKFFLVDFLFYFDLFFWYKNIKEEELMFLKLYNNAIFFWLTTMGKGNIKKINSRLHRGIRYYRNIYILKLNLRLNFKFINFLIEQYIPLISNRNDKIHKKNFNEVLFSFTDFNMFSNLRLSTNLYFNSVYDKLFIKLYSKNFKSNIFFDLFKF